MITIISATGRHYATLVECETGVHVTVWQSARNADQPIAKRLDEWLLDCPFHLACDAVHDILYPLADETAHTMKRRR